MPLQGINQFLYLKRLHSYCKTIRYASRRLNSPDHFGIVDDLEREQNHNVDEEDLNSDG